MPLIEINYRQPAATEAGYVVAQRLVREEDIVSVDPKADDATLSVMRVANSGSQFVMSFTDVTLEEAYGDFKTRYSASAESDRIVAAEALPEEPGP